MKSHENVIYYKNSKKIYNKINKLRKIYDKLWKISINNGNTIYYEKYYILWKYIIKYENTKTL